MSLDNLKKAIRETANEPVAAAQDSLLEDPLVEDTLVDNILVEDAPATPMFGFDTSLKEINEAIRRAEFRSLQNDSPLKESAIRQQVVQGFRLNGNDAGASLANEAIIRKLTEENEKLRSQVVQFLES